MINKLYGALLLLIALMFVAVSGCIVQGPLETEQFTGDYEVGENTVLEVRNVNGDIEINKWDGNSVKLDAIKRTREGKEELQKVEIIVTESDNEIKIEAKYPPYQDVRVSVDMNIQVPGTVTVDFVRTSNGDVHISDVKGDVRGSSTNGHVTIDNVDGYVKADTTNGIINIQGTKGIGDLETTNGNIFAQVLDFEDDIKIKTTNGNIDLEMNPSLNADIEMRTSNGKISVKDITLTLSESEATYLEGKLGEGGNEVKVTTTNGNIDLNKLSQV